MEPNLPKPRVPGVEQSPQVYPEQAPIDVDRGLLQQEQEKNLPNPELDSAGLPTQAQPVQQQTNTDDVTQLLAQQPVSTSPTQLADDNGNPVVAGDDDVIEKEWVDKAKKIVSDTKDDPRLQKHSVSALQADYIEKRYGKIVKLPDES